PTYRSARKPGVRAKLNCLSNAHWHLLPPNGRSPLSAGEEAVRMLRPASIGRCRGRPASAHGKLPSHHNPAAPADTRRKAGSRPRSLALGAVTTAGGFVTSRP